MTAITPQVVRQILAARHIAVLHTDRTQRVQTAVGDKTVLGYLTTGVAHDADDLVGLTLTDVLPEITGYDEQVKQMLAGHGTMLRLPWINRTVANPAPGATQGAEGTEEADLATLRENTQYLDIVLMPLVQETEAMAQTLDEVAPPHTQDQPIIGLTCVIEESTATGQQHQQIVQQRNELHLLKERVEQESQALAIANAELDHANKTKSRFVSIAAHELRTPLAAITGYVDLLLENVFGPLNPEQVEFLNIILGSARRLLDITNNLLDATMIESGHIELSLNPFDLPHLIERVITELKPVFQNRNQTIHTHFSPDVGPGLIDETRTIQILNNLLSNASKYSPDGSDIDIHLTPAEEEGYLCIAVKDKGVGIPADEQDRLFSRFFRASTAQFVNASGAGLGLHITAHLAELHGGRIWLESQPQLGSTFYVTLPTWEEKQEK
jgi:signal transduction histidine kinase